MLQFLESHLQQEIITVVLVFVYLISKFFIAKIVKKFSSKSLKYASRTQVIIKYINILLFILFLIFIFLIWGIKTEHLALAFSSIFAAFGVAMFASWSLLSNITSGVIIFFTAPFHIGDIIKIHDKDFPFEAIIIDIKGFHIYLETQNGESVVIPNSVFFTKSVSVLKKFTEPNE
jgi:small-conductance mechanosensitive channel